MSSGHRTEHDDDGEQSYGRCGGILKELEADIAVRETLCGDARPDDGYGEESRAEKLS